MEQRLDVLEDMLNENEEYCAVRRAQIQAQEKLETMGLTREQKELP